MFSRPGQKHDEKKQMVSERESMSSKKYAWIEDMLEEQGASL